MIGVTPQLLRPFILFTVGFTRPRQKVRIADDGRHRCTNLVTHIGQEKTFLAGRLLGPQHRFLQFLGLEFQVSLGFAQALNGRIQDIKDQLSDLETKKQEAEKQLAEYNERLARLDQEAKEIMEQYIQQGHDAKARILEAAEASAAKLEEQAKRNIEHEFEQAKQTLHAEIIEKALVEAEAIVKAKITDDDQNRLVDEYLEKVVA